MSDLMDGNPIRSPETISPEAHLQRIAENAMGILGGQIAKFAQVTNCNTLSELHNLDKIPTGSRLIEASAERVHIALGPNQDIYSIIEPNRHTISITYAPEADIFIEYTPTTPQAGIFRLTHNVLPMGSTERQIQRISLLEPLAVDLSTMERRTVAGITHPAMRLSGKNLTVQLADGSMKVLPTFNFYYDHLTPNGITQLIGIELDGNTIPIDLTPAKLDPRFMILEDTTQTDLLIPGLVPIYRQLNVLSTILGMLPRDLQNRPQID